MRRLQAYHTHSNQPFPDNDIDPPPIPRYFAEKAGLDPSPYLVPDEDLYDAHHPITNVIRWAKDAGLQVILVSVLTIGHCRSFIHTSITGDACSKRLNRT